MTILTIVTLAILATLALALWLTRGRSVAGETGGAEHWARVDERKGLK